MSSPDAPLPPESASGPGPRTTQVDPEDLPIPLFRARVDGVVTWSNAALRALLHADAVAPAETLNLSSLHPDEESWPQLVNRLDEEGEVRAYQSRIRPLKGEVRHVEYRVRAERGRDGALRGLGGALLDVEDRARRELRLRHAAFHDPLTGLVNRTLLMERLHRNLQELRRQRGHLVAVVFLDLNGFKEVNDAFGHKVGDDILRKAAEALQRTVRPRDTVARYGGDEFVIVLTDLPEVGEAAGAARRVVDSLTGVILPQAGPSRPLTACAGVSLSYDPLASPSGLIQEADEAMYQAKGDGPGGIRLHARIDAHSIPHTAEPSRAQP